MFLGGVYVIIFLTEDKENKNKQLKKKEFCGQCHVSPITLMCKVKKTHVSVTSSGEMASSLLFITCNYSVLICLFFSSSSVSLQLSFIFYKLPTC